MAINKIIYQGDTLIDLTNDTVTPETLAEGVTAHAKNGEIIVGSMTGGGGASFEAVNVTVHIDTIEYDGALMGAYFNGMILDENGYVVETFKDFDTNTDVTIRTPKGSLFFIVVESLSGEGFADVVWDELIGANFYMSNNFINVFDAYEDATIKIKYKGHMG